MALELFENVIFETNPDNMLSLGILGYFALGVGNIHCLQDFTRFKEAYEGYFGPGSFERHLAWGLGKATTECYLIVNDFKKIVEKYGKTEIH